MDKVYRIIGATGPIDWLPDLTKNLDDKRIEAR